MAKTYPTIGPFTAGDILTAATMTDIQTNLTNQRVPPMCRINQTSGQTINDATNTVLTFAGEQFDTDGMHDLVTNNSRITIQDGRRLPSHRFRELHSWRFRRRRNQHSEKRERRDRWLRCLWPG
jgi:hypothetical protein